MSIDNNPMLTPKQAANLINIPTSTFYKWLKSKNIPHSKIGYKTIRIPYAKFITWINNNLH